MQRAIMGDCVAWNPEIAPQANRDKHHGPHGQALGMDHVKGLPQLRHIVIGIDYDSCADAHCHDDQTYAKDRVNLTDDFVDGQEGRHQIIQQDHHQPEGGIQCLGRQHADQRSGTKGEVGTHQNQQDDREDSHDDRHDLAHVDSNDFGNGCAIVALAHHTGQKIMDTAAQNSTKNDLQVDPRPPACTGQCAINGAQTSNVQ